MGKYIDLTAENFNIAKEGVALVDFWAPWCGPCRMLAPVIDELAEEFDGKAKICKVNTDEVQDLAVEYGVRSIPTLLFFKDITASSLVCREHYTADIGSALGIDHSIHQTQNIQ